MTGPMAEDFPEKFDWEAFSRDSGEDGIHEPSAEERAASRRELHVDANEMYDDDTQAFIFLLAHLVAKMGGAVAITREDRQVYYSLGIDQSELATTGVLRLFAHLEELPS